MDGAWLLLGGSRVTSCHSSQRRRERGLALLDLSFSELSMTSFASSNMARQDAQEEVAVGRSWFAEGLRLPNRSSGSESVCTLGSCRKDYPRHA